MAIPLVPDILCLTTIFSNGTVGIANSMLNVPGNTVFPSSNEPGLPNFEKTIIKTFAVSFQPIITVIEAAGGILIAAQEIMQNPNVAEWPGIIADRIASPIVDALAIISSLLPPTPEAIGNLMLSPIMTNLKLPIDNFYFPASSFKPLESIFPDLVIPIPSFGTPSKPEFPVIAGLPGVPPNLKVLLGIISFPLNFIFEVFEPIKLIFEAITNPTLLPQAVTDLIALPLNLMPTIDNIISKVISAIGIPPEFLSVALGTFTTLIQKFAESLLNIIGLILGLTDCPS